MSDFQSDRVGSNPTGRTKGNRMKNYYLSLSFKGDVWDIEEEIEDVLGAASGSGFAFGSGERDLSYEFTDKKSLFFAVKKVRQMRRRIRCAAWDMTTEDWEKISLTGIR